MFGLFGKRHHYQRRADQVWMTPQIKLSQLVSQARQLADGATVVIGAHSRDTFKTLREVLGFEAAGVHLIEAHRINKHALADLAKGKPIHLLMAEFHPSLSRDEAVLAAIDTPDLKVTVQFNTSFDEEPLRSFADPRLKELLTKLGMSETEGISHSMVTRAIENARKKGARPAVS